MEKSAAWEGDSLKMAFHWILSKARWLQFTSSYPNP
jgi:hypothetical protein